MSAQRVPSFRIQGGKVTIREWIVSHFPTDITTYVEPFCGKGNVFFQVAHDNRFHLDRVYLNDKYNADQLLAVYDVEDCSFLPDSKDEWEGLYQRMRSMNPEDLTPQDLMIELFIMFTGMRVNKPDYKPGCVDRSKNTKNDKARMAQRLIAARDTLRKYPTTISQLDWREFMDSVPLDAGTFVYFDPPYDDPASHKFKSLCSYKNLDHRELLAYLDILTKNGVRWAISGYMTDNYAEFMQGKSFTCIDTKAKIGMNYGKPHPERTEYLWMNY